MSGTEEQRSSVQLVCKDSVFQVRECADQESGKQAEISREKRGEPADSWGKLHRKKAANMRWMQGLKQRRNSEIWLGLV